ANALISAIPPAAAAPVRNIDGNGQKGPCALIPPAASDRNITASTGDRTSAQPRNPRAETAETAAMCTHRSPVLSECAATNTIAIAATTFGIAETKPT